MLCVHALQADYVIRESLLDLESLNIFDVRVFCGEIVKNKERQSVWALTN